MVAGDADVVEVLLRIEVLSGKCERRRGCEGDAGVVWWVREGEREDAGLDLRCEQWV